MRQQNITKKILREMTVGQTRIFTLEGKKQALVARVTCTHLKNEENLVYRVNVSYRDNAISITRTA